MNKFFFFIFLVRNFFWITLDYSNYHVVQDWQTFLIPYSESKILYRVSFDYMKK